MAQPQLSQVFLYGIIVTEKSFRKGVRAFVKADISRKQLCKSTENKVPGEILNQMLDHADSDARRLVDEMWAACTTREAIEQNFAFFDNEIAGPQVSMLDLVCYTYLVRMDHKIDQNRPTWVSGHIRSL